MGRRVTGARIKKNRTYSVEEAAEALGVTQQTIRAWIKSGLKVFDSRRPTLILGEVLKKFLDSRVKLRKRPLAFGEVYCVGCHDIRKSEHGAVDYKPMDDRKGLLRAICPVCTTICNRILSTSDLPLYGDLLGNSSGSPKQD